MTLECRSRPTFVDSHGHVDKMLEGCDKIGPITIFVDFICRRVRPEFTADTLPPSLAWFDSHGSCDKFKPQEPDSVTRLLQDVACTEAGFFKRFVYIKKFPVLSASDPYLVPLGCCSGVEMFGVAVDFYFLPRTIRLVDTDERSIDCCITPALIWGADTTKQSWPLGRFYTAAAVDDDRQPICDPTDPMFLSRPFGAFVDSHGEFDKATLYDGTPLNLAVIGDLACLQFNRTILCLDGTTAIAQEFVLQPTQDIYEVGYPAQFDKVDEEPVGECCVCPVLPCGPVGAGASYYPSGSGIPSGGCPPPPCDSDHVETPCCPNVCVPKHLKAIIRIQCTVPPPAEYVIGPFDLIYDDNAGEWVGNPSDPCFSEEIRMKCIAALGRFAIRCKEGGYQQSAVEGCCPMFAIFSPVSGCHCTCCLGGTCGTIRIDVFEP